MIAAAAMISQSQNTFCERKMPEISDGQYQFIVPFMLYADFENILKPVNEQYMEKMNQRQTKRKVKTPIQKRYAHVYRMDAMYTACLLKEMYLIQYLCIMVKTVK